MKITVTRGELKSMATGFAKIIPNKPSLPVLGYIKLDSRRGRLIAQATDLDQTAGYRFTSPELEGAGNILIPFQLLKDLSKGDSADAITLVMDDGKTVSVTNHVGGHSVTSTVECIDPEAWPDGDEDIPTTEAKGFMAAFRKVAQFVCPDVTRPVLCGVLIDGNGKGDHNATLVATDGRRMTFCNSLKLLVDEKNGVIVPVTKFLSWTGLPEEVEFGMARDKSTTRLCVKAGPWTYVTKAINGIYPNWRQVLPNQESMTHRICFTDSEVSALRQILPTLPGKHAIVLEGVDDKLSLCTADDTGKQLKVPLTAGSTYTGSGCRLILDRRYLLDAFNAGFRNFLFASASSPILSQDGKGGTHVLMPLRDDPVKEPVAESTPAEPVAAPAQPEPKPVAVTAAQSVEPVAQPEPIQEKHDMNTNNETKNSQNNQENPASALETLQASFDSAKAKLRDAQFSLVEVGASLREALKEERQRRAEAESVRSTLRKLQSIRV